MRRLVLLTLALPLFGYTNCQHFSEVTVPATDTTVPVMFSSLIDGTQQNSFGPIHVRYRDLRYVVAMSSILDQGGACILEMTHGAEVECRRGNGGYIEFVELPTLRDRYPGPVGARVSNGIYLMHGVDLAALASLCDAGYLAGQIDYTWSMIGEDCHGNSARMTGGSIQYQR